MEANDYQFLALTTQNKELSKTEQVLIAGLGLGGEAGEVLEHIKKWAGHSQPLDRDQLKNELGDVLWYISTLAATVELSLSEIMEFNIDKLKSRWPEGFNPSLPQAAGE